MNSKKLCLPKMLRASSDSSIRFPSTNIFYSTETLEKIESQCVLGNIRNCVASVQDCALRRNLCKGKQIHSYMIVSGFSDSPFSVTSLINMYSKCYAVDSALDVFHISKTRNLFGYNAIISGLVGSGFSEQAIKLYVKMRRCNVSPDKFTFPSLIKACTDMGKLQEGEIIHLELFKLGLESDVFVASSLINFYLKFCLINKAQKLFDQMAERDVVLWNSLINGYAQIEQFEKALEIYRKMREEGLPSSKFTVTGILSVFTALSSLLDGKKIHAFIKKTNYESDVVVCNSLIDMYGKCKIIEDAKKVFEEMPERDIFSWNSIISVCEQCGDYDSTLRLFDRMRKEGVQFDSVTISSVLPACSHLAAMTRGREIHGFMIVTGLRADGDVFLDNAIMDMYGKCGSLRDARLLFDKMSHRDVASWNIMIMNYGIHGKANEALNLFSVMETSSIKPDEVTFVGILSACSHKGLVDIGKNILFRMEVEYGVVPTVEHYACVVDMFGRSGKLSEAYEIALMMPIKSNPVVWRALLAACRQHSDSNLAEIAAKHVLELDPDHCGSYVLLSNVYGAEGRHQDVSEVREAMRKQKVRKTPGCSWIEIHGKIHVFVTDDKGHSESEKLYSLLQMLISVLYEYGYAPGMKHLCLTE